MRIITIMNVQLFECVQSIVYTTSLGNLKKTVFNQQVARARAAITPMASPTAVMSADFVARIEAIKKNEEMKKVGATAGRRETSGHCLKSDYFFVFKSKQNLTFTMCPEGFCVCGISDYYFTL